MAIIDYIGIENTIKTLLDADSRTNDNTIEVEGEFMLKPDQCPYIGIFLNTHETLEDTETIGGTNPYLTGLEIELWLYTFSFENYDAATRRDTLLGNVMAVLKDNKTLSDTVLYFQFGGGTFENQKNTAGLGFFKGVSLTLECQIKE